jgi:chorismate dehydratase
VREKLRIGEIPYLNLFPIFYVLKRDCDTEGYEFIEGVPSALNRMLREGGVDVSPSSSIEYLRYGYPLIEGHSISSMGPVKSILLFSRMPVASLDGREVSVTHQSGTSTALLDVIFKKFYGLRCGLRVTDSPLEKALKTHPAHLLIGDEALIEAQRAEGRDLYVYDLGELWYLQTGLPFVFALWIAGKGLPESKKELLERLKKDLDYSRDRAVEILPEIAEASPLRAVIPPDKTVQYWRMIDYGLGKEQRRGLELFGKYLKELGLLGP